MRDPAVIVLVGPRAAGKSTVGRALARRRGWDFEDSDQLIEAAVGTSVGEFLRAEGEARFRAVESQVVLARLAESGPRVLALGGGAVLSSATRRALLDCGAVVVHLDAAAATQLDRQRADRADRPPLTDLPLGQEIAAIAESRAPFYAAVRDLRIDTTEQSVATCVDAITAFLIRWVEE